MASILWVDEDFDKNIFVEVNNNAIPLAQNMGSWCGRAIAGAGTSNVTYLQVDNVVGHLGILRIPTGTTSGNSSVAFLGRDSQAGGPSPAEAMVPFFPDFIKMDMWVRMAAVSSISAKIGIGTDVSSNTFGTDSFYFDYNAASSANWRCVTRSAGVQTISDTGVPVTALSWYKLTLRVFTTANRLEHEGHSDGRGLGDFRFYINDVGVPGAESAFIHHSTNLPTNLTAGVIGARVETATAASRSMDIDRIRYVIDESAMVT